jgi:hypothetical protein
VFHASQIHQNEMVQDNNHYPDDYIKFSLKHHGKKSNFLDIGEEDINEKK